MSAILSSRLIVPAWVFLICATAVAQPNLTVSRLGLTSGGSGSDDFQYYGVFNGVRAFSFASTGCNLGATPAAYIAGPSGNHPVVATNMYRLLNGRFEQIGMSWLRHTFCAVGEPTCGNCQSTPCSSLGIGCAETSWGGLAGDPTLLGPHAQINPQGLGAGGTHTDPHPLPVGPDLIRGRLQLHDVDILAGGRNFAEAHYVTHDEPLGFRHDNASWREVNVTLTSIAGVLPGQASVHIGEPAILAWALIDPSVFLKDTTIPGEGRFHVGSKVTDLGNGTWDYEYAVYNINSDRAGGSFSVPIPSGVIVLSSGFHDVDYHSGDGLGGVDYDGTDWTVTQPAGSLTWFTESFAANPNANALRWGTLYNFRFVANAPPEALPGAVTVGLFKPGTPAAIAPRAFVPSANAVPIDCAIILAGDVNLDTAIDGLDVERFTAILVNGNGNAAEICAADLDGSNDGVVDLNDLPVFITCLLSGGCP